jgi:hypothetical protein
MASEVSICNRALQKLGASLISDLDEDSPNASACKVAYPALRDALLEKHRWSFAIKRAELVAETPAPDWGRENAYPLPSDFLRLIGDYDTDLTYAVDYEIEGDKLLSNFQSPFRIRYIARITDVDLMPSSFREALATYIAYELCEQITQSNTKKQLLSTDLKTELLDAKKINAIQRRPVDSPEDEWITRRI